VSKAEAFMVSAAEIFSIIVAMDEERGTGRDGKIPWHLKGDLRHFKEVTIATREPGKKNIVIMGRKTWDSLPERFRPLPGRINVVITRDKNLPLPACVFRADSLKGALALCRHDAIKDTFEAVYVIGGGQIYRQALRHPRCRRIYATHIHGSFCCDTFFPAFDRFQEMNVSPLLSEGAVSYHFAEYARKNIR
jgi:dihydrofolate reductase